MNHVVLQFGHPGGPLRRRGLERRQHVLCRGRVRVGVHRQGLHRLLLGFGVGLTAVERDLPPWLFGVFEGLSAVILKGYAQGSAKVRLQGARWEKDSIKPRNRT